MTLINTLLVTTLLVAAGCATNELGQLEADDGGDTTHGTAPREAFAAQKLAQCGDGDLTARGLAEIQRLPYLQRVTTEQALVLWTSTGAAGSVYVTLPDGTEVTEVKARADESALLPEGTQYVAVIDDLEPDTLYCYEVRESGEPLTQRTGFRTAPLADYSGKVRLISFGDMGKRTSDQFAVLSQLTTVNFDFALLNGDIAYEDGTLADFESNIFDVYGQQMRNAPFFAASGNHEYHTNDARPFRDVFALFENGAPQGTERWYSFDWGPVHVAVLDTEKVNDVQAAWLDADLAANELPWTIVVGHRPPYSSGYHGSSGNVRSTFGPVFEKHGVDLTFWGHDHDYERTIPINGVTYVVAGGGGVGTRPVGSSDFTAFADQVSHFVYVEADRHQLTLWAIDATGKDYDSLVLQK